MQIYTLNNNYIKNTNFKPADKGDVGNKGIQGLQGDKGNKGEFAIFTNRQMRRLENAESQAGQLKNENDAQETKIDQSIELHKNFNVELLTLLNKIAKLMNQKF
jgi:hypothetical protein